MSITKVFDPRINQYTYYKKENGQLIPLTYEDGLKQGLAILEPIEVEAAKLQEAYNKGFSDAINRVIKGVEQ